MSRQVVPPILQKIKGIGNAHGLAKNALPCSLCQHKKALAAFQKKSVPVSLAAKPLLSLLPVSLKAFIATMRQTT
jgi:hypothetical protein